jgi:hypothetical protein
MSNNWNPVLADPRFCTFEDPFSGTSVPKQVYNDMYGPACRVVIQESFTVRMFYEENPLMVGEWRFRDDDSRADIYDAAVELGIVPTAEEVKQGETKTEATKRKKTFKDMIERFQVVEELLKTDLSNKKRKKLERELRGLTAAIESSTSSIDV